MGANSPLSVSCEALITSYCVLRKNLNLNIYLKRYQEAVDYDVYRVIYRNYYTLHNGSHRQIRMGKSNFLSK